MNPISVLFAGTSKTKSTFPSVNTSADAVIPEFSSVNTPFSSEFNKKYPGASILNFNVVFHGSTIIGSNATASPAFGDSPEYKAS